MPPDYTTFTIPDFLDDASFIRWVKGDAGATAFWEGWLAAAPPNAAAARQAAQQLRLLLAARPLALGEHTLRFIWHDITASIAEREARVRRTWRWLAAAATVAGIGLGGWLLRPAAPAMQLLATPYGQQRQLTLPDGTLVTLNAHSRLRYRRAWQPGQVREVWLQGEAFFRVRHLDTDGRIAPGERFRVHAGRVDVEVLGTTFNVKQRRATTQVVLQTGRVQVSLAGGAAAPLVLAPREEARYDSASQRLTRLPAAATAPALAWTEQRLVLHHTTVNDILATVQDTYGYRAVLADPRLGEREIEGELPLRDEKSVLFVLSAVLHTPVVKRDSTLYIGFKTTN